MVKSFTEVLSALFGREHRDGVQSLLVQERCLACNTSLVEQELYTEFGICPVCRFHYSITARQRIQLLVDPKSFKEKYQNISSLDPLSFKGKVPYRRRLFRDQRRTGLTEAAVVGYCRIGGIKTVLLLLDFSFMGGSMGCVVGEKVALAFELAISERLPVVAIVSSGGVRIQEGLLSLMQMAKTAATVNRLQEFGIPYIGVLANPSTGQAYASFANMAHVLLAEPGALVGFAPLRLLQEAEGKPLPMGSHTAEAHKTHGMIDAILDRQEIRYTLISLLRRMSPQRQQVTFLRPRGKVTPPKERLEPWDAVQRERRSDRPTAADYVKVLLSDFVELHGDRLSGDDPAILCGVGSLEGCSVILIGQQRLSDINGNPHSTYISPEGFRKCQRAMRLAANLGMPLITLIDTAGPAITLQAEEGGLGNAIAGTLALMSGLPIPIVAVIVGEGGREGALSLGIADRVLMLESAIYCPISPENAAELMYRDENRTQEAAESLRLTAADALEMRIIDGIVPEPLGGAHQDPEEAANLLRRAVIRALGQVQSLSPGSLLSRRYKKFRNMGEYTPYFYAALLREVDTLQGFVGNQVEEVRTRRRRRKDNGKDKEAGTILTLPDPSTELGSINEEEFLPAPLEFPPIEKDNQAQE
jgi:acetyl-CoA carboxylase carboxyl transferase alpha subunit/acetyl-CoA carboxylase carboxyl transferase beta subunit